jgi:phosphoribosyl 1,2-cyclic phosphodiesterase
MMNTARSPEFISGGTLPGESRARAPVSIRFWGVRGSIPTPGAATLKYGGNTSCIEIRAGDQIIILDAGTGLRLLGKALSAEFGDTPLDLLLLLSHTHWDHIQGLPFFLPVYKPQNRLRILGYEGARNALRSVLSNQMETPFFPIGLRDVPANIDIEELLETEFTVDCVQVKAAFANHPGVCAGYRLFHSGISIAYFPDNELRCAPEAQKDRMPPRLDFVREQNLDLVRFLSGTDVLIMDTQYDRQEYEHHTGWGHGCLDEVVLLSIAAGVKKLFLFHHDPDHDDDKISSMAVEARRLVSQHGGAVQIEPAREGAVVELPLGAGTKPV